jgi:hypothetical protein
MFPRNVGLLLVAVALCFGAVTLRGPPEFSLMAKALDDSENHVDARRALNDPAGTELSTRSPGTVDTLLRERFLGLIFSLVSSTLFWQGLGVATTMWAAGCTIAGAASSKFAQTSLTHLKLSSTPERSPGFTNANQNQY